MAIVARHVPEHPRPELCASCPSTPFGLCGTQLHATDLELEHIAYDLALPRRHTLFRQGDDVDYVYSLKSGMLRLSTMLADGRRQVIGFVLQGDFLGLTLPTQHTFTAETLTEVEICRFRRGEFQRFLDERPVLLRKLHILTANELALSREQMVLLGRLHAEEKLAAFLLNLRRRYQRADDRHDLYIHLPMTRQDIGDYLGLSLETVSRTFSKFAREKVICIVPDGVRLIMPDRLQELVR